MMVHQARFAQAGGLSQHANRSAVVTVPVEYFPATVEEIAFIYFFDWHFAERSYGKDKCKE